MEIKIKAENEAINTFHIIMKAPLYSCSKVADKAQIKYNCVLW